MAIQSPSIDMTAGAAVPVVRSARRAATGSRSAAACGAIR